MSPNPKHDIAGEQPEGHDDMSRASENDSQDYEVGYRKPPAKTQFKKGKSGNPFGRPRKAKERKLRFADAATEIFLQKEAYRLIAVRENGRISELPAVEALLRALLAKALSGNRLAAQYLLEWISAAEEKHYKSEQTYQDTLRKLKRDGEAAIAEHKRKNLPSPELLPHPDDILIDLETGSAHLNGPITAEQANGWAYLVSMRNHFLLRSVHAEKTGVGKKKEEGKTYCAFMFVAVKTDYGLPKRMKWKNREEFDSCFSRYLNMNQSELEQRIKMEWAELEANTPQVYISQEAQEILDRVRNYFSENTERA